MPPRRPRFTYDATLAKYRSTRTGRFVDRRTIRRWLEERVTASRTRVVALGEQLRTGDVSLTGWRTRMRRELKNLHGLSAMAAKGGRAQMDAAAWGRIGAQLRYQYSKLERFARQIADGLPLGGRFDRRVKMYADSARTTYHESQREAMLDVGYLVERNVRHSADSCEGCVEETRRGWVPIGELTPIGQRECLTSCLCEIEYGPEDAVVARRRSAA